MHENFVKDWIEEFQKVTINDVASYGDREKNNQEIVHAIFTIFKTSSHSQVKLSLIGNSRLNSHVLTLPNSRIKPS